MATIRVHKIDGRPVNGYRAPRRPVLETLSESIVRIAVGSGIGCLGILFYGIITLAK